MDFQIQNLFFGIDIQKKFSISYTWDMAKIVVYKEIGKFLTYRRNCEQKATIGIIKFILKKLPQHNGVVPIKITGQIIKEHMAYFIMDEGSTKGRDPNINIINGIHNIKGKHLLMFWYPITQTNTLNLTKDIT